MRCFFQKTFFCLSVCLLSCTSFETNQYEKEKYLKKPRASEAGQSEKQKWHKIKNEKAKPLSERIKTISDFIELYEGKDIVLEAYLLKAELLSRNKQHKEACLNYHRLVQSAYYYTKSLKAYKASARCYLNAGRLNEALVILEKLIQTPHSSFGDKREAAKMQWSFVRYRKLFIKWKLISLSHLLLFSTDKKEKQIWKNKGEKIINSLSEKKIVSYAKQFEEITFFGAYLLYKAGVHLWNNEKFLEAKKLFKKVLVMPLSSKRKKQVKQKLDLLEQVSQVNPYLVGVLIPLSGRKKALGEKILRALVLGLDMEKDSPWQMVILDSKSHPDVVRNHLESLFYKHQVIGIIGGFTSETAEVIAEKAEELLIPALLFSQKEDLALSRKFVFQNSITASYLLTRLVQQSQKRLNIKKAAILYPNDSYGKNYARLFDEIFTKQGGEVVGKAVYKFGEVDFKDSVKKLLHLNIKGREKEFEELKRKMLENTKAITDRSRKLIPENILPIKKEFEALFIPDSLSQVKKITDHLRYFGVKDIYLLGTNLWSPEQKTFRSKEFPLVFVNLPKKDNASVRKTSFYRDFVGAYAQPPGLFEQRAYNAALFLKEALNQKVKSRLLFQKKLKRIQKYQGAGYTLLISKEGVFQYPLYFYIRDFNKLHTLDSIPVK